MICIRHWKAGADCGESAPELQKWMKNAVVDSYLNMVQKASMYQKCYPKFIKKRFLWGKPTTLESFSGAGMYP
ncbi:MAG: hypothetical protein V8S36_08505 [Lachnospiraceae bacterium]